MSLGVGSIILFALDDWFGSNGSASDRDGAIALLLGRMAEFRYDSRAWLPDF